MSKSKLEIYMEAVEGISEGLEKLRGYLVKKPNARNIKEFEDATEYMKEMEKTYLEPLKNAANIEGLSPEMKAAAQALYTKWKDTSSAITRSLEVFTSVLTIPMANDELKPVITSLNRANTNITDLSGFLEAKYGGSAQENIQNFVGASLDASGENREPAKALHSELMAQLDALKPENRGEQGFEEALLGLLFSEAGEINKEIFKDKKFSEETKAFVDQILTMDGKTQAGAEVYADLSKLFKERFDLEGKKGATVQLAVDELRQLGLSKRDGNALNNADDEQFLQELINEFLIDTKDGGELNLEFLREKLGDLSTDVQKLFRSEIAHIDQKFEENTMEKMRPEFLKDGTAWFEEHKEGVHEALDFVSDALKGFPDLYEDWGATTIGSIGTAFDGIDKVYTTLSEQGIHTMQAQSSAFFQALEVSATIAFDALDNVFKNAIKNQKESIAEQYDVAAILEEQQALQAEIDEYNEDLQAEREEEKEEKKELDHQQKMEDFDQEILDLEYQLQNETNVNKRFALLEEIEKKRQEKVKAEREKREAEQEERRLEKEINTRTTFSEDMEDLKDEQAKKDHDRLERTREAEQENERKKAITDKARNILKLSVLLATTFAELTRDWWNPGLLAAVITIPTQIATIGAMPLPQVDPIRPFNLAQGGIFPGAVFPPVTGGYPFSPGRTRSTLTHNLPDPRYVVAEAGSPEAVLPLSKATFSRLGIGGEQKSYTMNNTFNLQITAEVEEDKFMETLRNNISELWEDLQREEVFRNPDKW